VECKVASDFVGSAVGESQEKTQTIIALGQGKVVLIDEAYALDDNMYGREVLNTIVEKVMGAPGEDIAMVLIGYEREVEKMLRDQVSVTNVVCSAGHSVLEYVIRMLCWTRRRRV
jgi:hypothetical protein